MDIDGEFSRAIATVARSTSSNLRLLWKMSRFFLSMASSRSSTKGTFQFDDFSYLSMRKIMFKTKLLEIRGYRYTVYLPNPPPGLSFGAC